MHKRAQAVAATVLTLLAGGAMLSGCGGSNATAAGNAPSSKGHITLTWWNNATSGSLASTWTQAAAAFHAMHPQVTIKNIPIQNEELQNTKEPTALQSGNPPDIFQQWGGGREASEVPSGELMNLTQATRSWIGELGSRRS